MSSWEQFKVWSTHSNSIAKQFQKSSPPANAIQSAAAVTLTDVYHRQFEEATF